MTMTWPDWMIYRTETERNADLSKKGLNTLRDVARQVLAAINGITLLGPNDGVVWRGQADATWRLESKAGRQGFTADDMKDQEQEMLRRARKIGADGAQYMGDWEILARLRHHGAATRLIDCTTDPFVALWFLCDDDAPARNGELLREQNGVLLAVQRDKFTQINKPYEQNYDEAFERPSARLMYSTPLIDPRIAAQRGMFVLHTQPQGKSIWPESELGELKPPTSSWKVNYGNYLHKLCGTDDLSNKRGRMQATFPDIIGISIPSQVKSILLEMLERNFGFTREALFPDFAGLAEYYDVRRR